MEETEEEEEEEDMVHMVDTAREVSVKNVTWVMP